MKIEIYADVVCPWCYIGEQRFAQALRSFEHADDVEVVFRPFQLDPDAPRTGIPLRDYLRKRYGTRASSMIQSAEDAGHLEGIRMDFHRAIAANTSAAHRLMMLALDEYGPAVQRALAEGLYAAHFEHGENVADEDVLVRLASAAGMSAERARSSLERGEGEEALRNALAHAQALGVRAVPMFVIDGKYAIQGAQPASTMLKVLNEVAAEAVRD